MKLYASVSPDEARGQLVFLEAALAQYDPARLEAVIAGGEDWPLSRVRRATPGGRPRDRVLLELVSPAGDVAREWPALAHPAELGLLLRHVLGPPRGGPSITP